LRENTASLHDHGSGETLLRRRLLPLIFVKVLP